MGRLIFITLQHINENSFNFVQNSQIVFEAKDRQRQSRCVETAQERNRIIFLYKEIFPLNLRVYLITFLALPISANT